MCEEGRTGQREECGRKGRSVERKEIQENRKINGKRRKDASRPVREKRCGKMRRTMEREEM